MSNEVKFIFTGDPSGAVAAVNKVAGATTKLNTSFKQVTTGSNAASQSLLNLGRVAQDAPFGFIGIANNLNPLLESFQRLRIETGSAKGALSALGSSLIGGGGLGLALSLITAAVSFASIGFQAWSGHVNKNKKDLDENGKTVEYVADTYDKLRERVMQLTATAATESTKVQILGAALADTNLPLSRRKALIEDLNKISPKYLGDLDAEKSSYDEITASINNYLTSLAQQVEVKALLPEFEKIVQKVIAAQIELNKLTREGDMSLIFGDDGGQFLKEEKERLNKLIEQGKKQIIEAKKGFDIIAGGASSLTDLLFGKELQPKDKKAIKEKADKIKNEFIKAYTLDADRNPLVDLTPTINTTDLFGKQKKPQFLTDMEAAIAAIVAKMQELKEKSTEIADILNTTLAPAFTGLFNDILSGSENAFQTFGKMIAGVIKKLIAAAITAAIFAAIIAVATGGVGTVGSAAKFLSSFKSIFSQLSGLPKFASGVTNFRGGLALVGERGPELVNLPRGSDVIPNHMIGGGQGQLIEAFISNRGIYLSNKRGSLSAGRLG